MRSPMVWPMSAFVPQTGEKADILLLPCPFKYLTELDCPGCGFQRSVIALFQGDLSSSLALYPPTVPLLLTFGLLLLVKLNGKALRSSLINALFVVNGTIIMASYLFKIAKMLV